MPEICVTEDVLLNGVVLNRIDEDGNRWILNDIDGWWGLPDPEVPDESRPVEQDGSYYVAGRYKARTITIDGTIVPGAGGTLSVVEARNELNRAINLVKSAGILQVNETIPKQAMVQLVGRPLTKFESANNALKFNIQLRAADPRKYALNETAETVSLPNPEDVSGMSFPHTFNVSFGPGSSTGLMTVSNVGSYNTFGTFRIYGPITDPAIEHIDTGAVLAFDTVLNAGEFIDINLFTKTVMLNGTTSRRSALRFNSRWFEFAPGNSTIRFSGIEHLPDAESPMLYLAYRSAWIE